MISTQTLQPIDRWLDLVQHEIGHDQLEQLRDIYREYTPTQGELIFTGECEFACQHCIYHPGYAKFNSGLSVGEWKALLKDLNQGLGIETFVYGGRSVTRDGFEVLKGLRAMLPHARIGMIDNGISLKPYRDQLVSLNLDWIDISLDGMESEHDLQRGRKGSFAEAIESLRWLADHEIAPKINILTCLTTINQASILSLIQFLNREGFKNVFITPMSILEGYRPAKSFQVLGGAFATFIGKLEEVLGTLEDAWLELNMFGLEYPQAIGEHAPKLWQSFKKEIDHLTVKRSSGDNELSLNYFPESLTGTREFIVNSNGDVIVPKVMGKGKIPENEILGNLGKRRARAIVDHLANSPQFEFYAKELLREAQMMKEISWQPPIPVL